VVHEVVGSRTAYDWVLRRAVLALNGAHLVTWTVDSFDDPWYSPNSLDTFHSAV